MVVVEGYYFTGNLSTTDLFVAGKKQETVFVNCTMAKFRITDSDGVSLQNMKVYFDVGLPKGHDSVIDGQTL